MGRIRIATDSTADLPAALVKEYDIAVIPLKIIFGEEAYRENIDITTQEFYEKLAKAEKLPATSQPSPGEFQEFYEELTKDGSAVISIHISSLMSGTCQSANIAKAALADKDITVVDSRQVSAALGMVVITAAKAAKAGKGKEEILKIVQTMMEHVRAYFVVDTLENLEKGGRIGKATAFLGGMLNIKPVLTINDGLIGPFEKIRGKGKALERLVEVAKEYAAVHGNVRCIIAHADVLEEAIKVHERISSEVQCTEIILGEVGAVVGTHAGAGTVAVFFYEAELEDRLLS
ncbi:MAG TPA: DegV family protein [Peptococcaceae bacterium]|jgi:DegV family protein with EDD domain|nr:DegV family protein [Clostridia bacterium]HPZ71751.1 DegV family protein [Peptococcaceae bacterium]HQD53363.1 DegV family protein [Peptococcaceae bacterium]